MGLSASQARQLLLTAKRNDLEFRAQQISQQRLILSSQLEEIATEYENATSNRQMQIQLYSGGNAEDANALKQTSNLTYADLVSGCHNIKGASKINVEKRELMATTAYHLKNADGAIVISDISEIPGISKGDSVYSPAEYETKTLTDEDGNETTVPKTTYYYKSNGDFKVANLASNFQDGVQYIASDSGSYVKQNNTFVKYVGSEEQEGLQRYKKNSSVQLYKESEIDNNTIANRITNALDTNGTIDSNDDKKDITNGMHIIVSKTGTIKVGTRNDEGNFEYTEYVLDKNLQRGGTDVNGNSGGPNYLQEMLRNGVYTLDRYNAEQDQWSSVSWDSAVGITDRYYTEDDDAAKAKYDRLQNEIQRQDKKLELELDNIETQRSAITTEEESVQKVMDDNIEGTFKTFA